ncbi:transcriptional regulator [Streptomyces minutiscleroticus]|uniref:Transcriptional regulator n=1 Tax=Streptomyces minutiscleroticus TaxID=68238 RepID=A0A918KEE0_9ACTN|nr:helix-turn-helix transcriptional regulator [Streptomyces minutiscleroticus]GGX59632.1 transcriptional regulator [Streptomyces minutiscleroticus]
MHSSELSDFLRSRRAALTPQDVGLPWRSGARRVKGLRREELALLAGVSADYYTRLEQGRAKNVSAQVLSAVADALRLTGLERRHLFSMARPGLVPDGPRRAPALRARPAVRMMMDALDPTPVMLHGPRLEAIAANRMGRVLIDDFDAMPAAERNLARWMFLDPRARTVYPDWEEIAAQTVAVLRVAAGEEPDPALTGLVGELSSRSDDFARVWAEYRVFRHTHGRKRFHHEAVGTMTLNYESLALSADPGLSLLVYTADTGSPSEEKLRILSGRAEERNARAPADLTGAEKAQGAP